MVQDSVARNDLEVRDVQGLRGALLRVLTPPVVPDGSPGQSEGQMGNRHLAAQRITRLATTTFALVTVVGGLGWVVFSGSIRRGSGSQAPSLGDRCRSHRSAYEGFCHSPDDSKLGSLRGGSFMASPSATAPLPAPGSVKPLIVG